MKDSRETRTSPSPRPSPLTGRHPGRGRFAQAARTLVGGLIVAIALPAWATFHEMQIEQIIGGVNGDTSAQAIQLRMRSFGQNLTSQGRLVAYDAAGLNPVVVINFTGNVANGLAGARVLVTSPNFAPYTDGALAGDFTMTNLIPESYLAAGRLTFEDDNGPILWSVSWGGSNYTGSTTGAFDNDADGQFGPSVAVPMPTTGVQALQFQGNANAPSTNNEADYALTAGASQWVNNAGQSAMLIAGLHVVTTTGDDGIGSLRDAILNANASAESSMIHFAIQPFDGTVKTIALESGLPTITSPVIIDGYTQPGASANTLSIGTDAVLLIELDGTDAGQANGLVISAGNSTVRGLVINHFVTPCCIGFGFGIILTSNGNNVVEGNFVGTDATGTIDGDNGDTGVSITGGSSGNVIGGNTPAARNVISKNGALGVDICCDENSAGNRVLGNYIGTDKHGTAALGNNSGGVRIAYSANNVVGGADPSTRNVISANPTGITIAQNEAIGNVVQGNLIGTAADGVSPLGNMTGVAFFNAASNNLIGGTAPGEGNVIAFSTGAGVQLGGGVPANGFDLSNAILGNSIFSNGGLGIDLLESNAVSGVTANDDCDADIGANNLQNFPVLASAANTAAGTVIEGSLDSAANTTFRIEFFVNPACDPSGFGEGKEFIGSTNVMTDGECHADFAVTFPLAVAEGEFITATATGPANNTSEFSQCIEAVNHVVTIACSISPQNATNELGALHTVTSMITSNGVPVGGVTVDFLVTAGPNAGAADSDTTDGNGDAAFSYTGNGGAGADTIIATGLVAGVSFSCEATKLWVEPPPLQVNCGLAPASDTNQVGTAHSVVSTVTTNSNPAPGVTVHFEVVSGPNAGATASTLTDGGGQATFMYNSNGTPGTDTVMTTGIVSGVSFSCSATKVWVAGPCADLSGTLSKVKAKCKVKNDVQTCKLSGSLAVSNSGDAEVGESLVRYFLSDDNQFDAGDTQIGEGTVKAISVGKSGKGKLKATLIDNNPTGRFLIAVIDAGGAVSECSENNNLAVFGPIPAP